MVIAIISGTRARRRLHRWCGGSFRKLFGNHRDESVLVRTHSPAALGSARQVLSGAKHEYLWSVRTSQAHKTALSIA